MQRIFRPLHFFTALALILGLVPLSSSTMVSKPPVLLKDINAIPFNSNPVSLYPLNDLLFFQADDTVHGIELWRTDGTQAGTWLVKDINPGAPSGPVYFGDTTFLYASLGNILFFAADDSAAADGHGAELWRTDGTPDGTWLVKDINPSGSSSPENLITAAGLVFFLADDGAGQRLWRTDGTPEGTLKVSDSLTRDESFYPLPMAAFGEMLYFEGCEPVHGCELWRTNGTPDHLEMVADINPGGDSAPRNLGAVGGVLYFSADDGQAGQELWKTDGAGASLVKDINPGSASSTPNHFTSFQGQAYFTAQTADSGRELWRSDGSPAGTELAAEISPGADSGMGSAIQLVVMGNALYFQGHDVTHGNELWKMDGSHAELVTDINPGRFNASIWYILPMNGVLYFSARNMYEADDDTPINAELWRSDGTSAGTWMVKEIAPGSSDGLDTYDTITCLGNRLYFRSLNKLWSSDGSEAGTQSTLLINRASTGSSIHYPVPFDNGLFFVANDGVHGYEPWITDGTPQGTRMIKDLVPGKSAGVNVNDLNPYLYPNPIVKGKKVYFAGYGSDAQGNPNAGIWVTDGSAQGTQQLTTIAPSGFTVIENQIFFLVKRFDGVTLMKNDGTPGGTVQVKSWGAEYYLPNLVWGIGFYEGILYFTIWTTIDQEDHLWQTDGTESGTIPAVMTPPVSAIYTKSGVTLANGLILYVDGGKLWQMDDTPGDEQMIPGDYYIYDQNGLDVGNWLYFLAPPAQGSNIHNLYRTQGVSTGVELLVENVYDFEGAIGEHVYFAQGDPSGEFWLGRYDGASQTTTIIKPATGTYHFQLRYMCPVVELYGRVFFTSDKPGPNLELWESDLTPAGTQRVADLGIALTDDPTSYLTAVNARLLFMGSDLAYGREWRVIDELDHHTFLPITNR